MDDLVKDEELPVLNQYIICIVWDYDNDSVDVNFEGLNRMEAIGLLDTALDKVRNDAFWADESEWDEDE